MSAEAVTSVYPELALVDELIGKLEALITESDETPLAISTAEQPKRSVYRIIGNSAIPDRKPKPAEAVYLDESHLILRCAKTEVVRQTTLEIAVQAEKSGRGETMAVVIGKALSLKRVRGGYDIDIEITEMRKTRVTPGQKLRECLGKNDPAAWNRWCQDIRDTMELAGMDLKKADLSGYDLCCSDLSGADLTGANLTGAILAGADLSGCTLEKATVTGADFFRAKMTRAQAWLLPLSGMPEVESVIFDS